MFLPQKQCHGCFIRTLNFNSTRPRELLLHLYYRKDGDSYVFLMLRVRCCFSELNWIETIFQKKYIFRLVTCLSQNLSICITKTFSKKEKRKTFSKKEQKNNNSFFRHWKWSDLIVYEWSKSIICSLFSAELTPIFRETVNVSSLLLRHWNTHFIARPLFFLSHHCSEH